MNRSTRYVAGYVPMSSGITSVANVQAAWIAIFAFLSEARQEAVQRLVRSSALRRGCWLRTRLVQVHNLQLSNACCISRIGTCGYFSAEIGKIPEQSTVVFKAVRQAGLIPGHVFGNG
jgi:hypothetical protein